MDFVFRILMPIVSIGLACFVLGRNSVSNQNPKRSKPKYNRTKQVH